MVHNSQDISMIADNIISIIQLCIHNKEKWMNDKPEMLKIIEKQNNFFYTCYNRMCHDVVEMDNLEPMVAMLKTFYKVQTGEISFEKANKIINDAINGTFVEPVLNSDKLKSEREEKLKIEEKLKK